MRGMNGSAFFPPSLQIEIVDCFDLYTSSLAKSDCAVVFLPFVSLAMFVARPYNAPTAWSLEICMGLNSTESNSPEKRSHVPLVEMKGQGGIHVNSKRI